MTAPGGSVLFEADTVSLTAGQATGVQQAYALRNPLHVPISIEDIYVNLNSNQATECRLRLRLNNDFLTNGYVPLWVLGPSVNSNNFSSLTDFAASDLTYIVQGVQAPIYGVHFTSPCVLLPGEQLQAEFINAGQLISSTVTAARILVRSRVLDAKAQRSSLPWIAPFVGAVQIANANTTEQSKESDLVNPFPVPLFVRRMMGVITSDVAAAQFYGTLAITAGLQYATIRINDEHGRPLVRDATPFAHLFQLQTYSWELRTVMPANSFYLAYLTENYSTLASTSHLQVLMSLVGHREVKS